MKIVLLGYMASGKTTIGKLLAKDLNLNFIDLDTYIQQSEGMTIPELFQSKGEIYFRKKEYEYLKEILEEQKNFVLSTGGGTPCYGDSMNTIINEAPNNFYLQVSLAGLVERLSSEKLERPLVKDISNEDLPEFIGKHLFERSFYYSQSNYTVTCDAKIPAIIVEEIKEKLRFRTNSRF